MSGASRRSTPLIWLTFSALIASGLACGNHDGAHDRRSRHDRRTPAADATPVEGGVLRVPIASDPRSFNPLLTGPEHLPEPWRRIYPVLLALEPRGAAPPSVLGDLARAWSWSPEQGTLTCTLRPGRFWEDTLRVTVGDVVRTYEAYRAAGWLARRAPGDSLPDPGLVAVAALDDSTVRLSYGPGTSLWHALPAAGWPVLPARKLADLSLPALQTNSLSHEPLSASSFRLTDWRHGLNLWLGPNPGALGRRNPFLDRVEMEICPGIDARILRLHLGRADLVASVPVYRLDTLLEGDTIPRLHHDGIAAVEMLWWNGSHPAFTAPVRRAVSFAIDRDRIVRELLTFNGIACGGPAAGFLEPRGPAEGAEDVDGDAPHEAPGGLLAPGDSTPAAEPARAADVTTPWLYGTGPRSGVRLSAPSLIDSLADRDRGAAWLSGSMDSARISFPTSADVGSAADTAAAGDTGSGSPTVPELDTGMFTAPPELRPRFDPGEANRLLDLAGWMERGPDGVRMRGGVPLRIELLYERDDELRERLATLLESDLAQVGIDLVARPVAGRAVWSRFRAGLFEAALVGFRPPAVPDVSEMWASWGYWNGGGYASFRVDSLCTALRKEESPRTVERLARRVESIVRRDGPVTFLVYREWTALLSPRVRGFQGTAADPLRGLERVWLADSTEAGL